MKIYLVSLAILSFTFISCGKASDDDHSNKPLEANADAKMESSESGSIQVGNPPEIVPNCEYEESKVDVAQIYAKCKDSMGDE